MIAASTIGTATDETATRFTGTISWLWVQTDYENDNNNEHD